jgi:hypothetical protein
VLYLVHESSDREILEYDSKGPGDHFLPFTLPDVEPISPFDMVLVRPPM